MRPEWKDRVKHWMAVLEKEFYEPLGEIAFDGFETILESDEPAGRKLDFLVQEINRETNTIGSKCQNASIARLVVDIKCDIEKIREQIQNIE